MLQGIHIVFDRSWNFLYEIHWCGKKSIFQCRYFLLLLVSEFPTWPWLEKDKSKQLTCHGYSSRKFRKPFLHMLWVWDGMGQNQRLATIQWKQWLCCDISRHWCPWCCSCIHAVYTARLWHFEPFDSCPAWSTTWSMFCITQVGCPILTHLLHQ